MVDYGRLSSLPTSFARCIIMKELPDRTLRLDMKRIVVCLAIVLTACGGADQAQITLDAGDSAASSDLPGGEVCTPACEGKSCGPDGCDGECGACEFQLERCTDAGLCEPTSCGSTKDCPGKLVCAKDPGICVVCVGDEDCPEGKTCGIDYECHEEFPCESDLDCKDYFLVCDKDAGKCVECLGSEDCEEEEYCLDNCCINDLCTAGEAHCDGVDVVTCVEDGSGEEVTRTCTDTQYCEEADCHEQVCLPGQTVCEDDLLHICGPMGKEIVETIDCQEQDEICYQGACVEPVCEANTTWCHDDFTAAACLEDGMSSTTAPCGADHYCEEGGCKPQVCNPGSVFCDGEIYKVCNDKGSAIQYEEDCSKKDQHCHEGICIDTVCPPDTVYCSDDESLATCAEDGMSFTTEACPAEHFCDEGDAGAQCLPWVCQPLLAFCEDNQAKVCNGKGSAVANEVDCGDAVCVDGACKPVICEAGSSNCDGKAVMQCDATGTHLQEVEICGEGQFCGEDGNAAACADQICTPNARTCQGTKVMECDDVGAALEEEKDCADDEEGCQDGECVEQVCGSLSFDGGDDYVEVPHSASLDLASGVTISLWFRTNPIATDKLLVRKGSLHGSYFIWVKPPLHLEYGVFTGATPHIVEGPPTLEPNEWNHFAKTYDGDTVRGYLNGRPHGTQTSPAGPFNTNSQPLRFGHGYPEHWDNAFFSGKLDEVAIWSAAIGEESIEDIVLSGIEPGQEQNLVGLWSFANDLDAGADLSGQGNDAEVHGASWLPEGAACAEGAVCGDGQQAPWEECDDGNTQGGDGCSGKCQLEEMVTIPDGVFWMGCNEALDDECEADEYPAHQVAVPEFLIDITQVTVDGYG